MSPLAAALLLLPSALAQEPEGRLPVHVTYEDGLWFKSDDGGAVPSVGFRES